MSKQRLTITWFALAALMAGVGCNGRGLGGGTKPGTLKRVGQPCDLGVGTTESQAVVNMGAQDCASGVCLKPVMDSTRAAQVPATGPTCTAECSSDEDCVGDQRDTRDPQDSRCSGNFVCAVPFTVGPLCCKRYCVCTDFLSPAGVTTPIACQAPNAHATCQGAGGSAPATGLGEETDLYISVSPIRRLDLMFMIDNSTGMAPKAQKMISQLPKLLTALKDPSSGTYPDLRIAIIDSDLGTGGQYASGSCGPNDTNNKSSFGDLGNFQMRGASGCGVNSGALWLEYTRGKAVNFNASKDIGEVFGCLASNLGSNGCGEEHQLQAFEFALVATSIDIPGRDPKQDAFLRPDAYLGLVFLTDEDDCSAATNSGMFGEANHPELKGESISLRCATRAHQCSGRNLTQSPPGYPTDAPFSASFASCSARTDACPNPTDGTGSTDTTGPTSCSPLKDYIHLAKEMKDLKKGTADEKLLVAGIFGWPLMVRNADGSPALDSNGKPQVDMANATYKIDVVPNPSSVDTASPKTYDYWPVCYDPDHLPPSNGFSADAWGWGAQGGLRLSAFIDEFGANGLKYSICERDFAPAMKDIGDTLARRISNLCVYAKLMDVDPVTPGLQPNCRVTYRLPMTNPDGTITYPESPESLPMCVAGATPQTVASDCWQLSYDKAKCPVTGLLITTVRTAAEIAQGPLAAGTKIGMRCWTCPEQVSVAGCDY